MAINLKQEIDKTRELTNNKNSKREYKWYYCSGGGVHSEDLLSMPKNIQDMIKQYNKIAIIDINFNLETGTWFKDSNINLNLEFSPSILFLKVKDLNYEDSRAVISTRYNASQSDAFYIHTGSGFITIWIKSFSKNEIIITTNSSYNRTIQISEIIAIG